MKTFGELDEIQSLENDSVLAANNPTDTMSNKIKFVNLKSQILNGVPTSKNDIGLGNVENTGDSNIPSENGTEKFTTGGAYILKEDIDKAYKTDDTTENNIEDSDYIPFYDNSSSDKKKTLWSNIKSKLKTYFDALYAKVHITSPQNGDMLVYNSTNEAWENQQVSYTATDVGAIPTTDKGISGGVAELDASGKVPSSQLPSFVDDVLEYTNQSSFPATGETGKIYVDTTTNKTYRWSGSAYVEISASLALGETSSTAYRGDRGKTAYDHSQITSGNPHNVTKSDVGLSNVGNFKAVSTVASQGLSDTEKSNARANIGAGTSSSDTKNTAGSTDSSSKLFLVGATSQAANPQTYSDNEVYTTSGVLTSKKLSTKALVALTGSGTAGSDKGSGVSPRYIPTLWTFNSGVTVANGEVYFIKIPTAGGTYGVWLSLNNGTNYYPVAISTGKNRFTTHYAANTVIAVTYESAGVCTCYARAGADATADVTGIFRVLNDYDANTTYSTMSSSELTTGTATSSRTVRADYLKSGIKSIVSAEGYTKNAGTVTSVATGVGLTGGSITSSGTIKAKLKSETASTLASAAMGSTSSRQYAVGVDKDGYLSVNIPWTNSTYSLKDYTATPTDLAAFVQGTATGTLTAHFRFKDTNNVLTLGAQWIRGYLQYQNAYGTAYQVDGKGFCTTQDQKTYLVTISGKDTFSVTKQLFRSPTGNATAAQVLSGYTFSNASSDGLTGSMANNGAVSQTLNTSTTSYTIPAGYHNGSGKVSITTETKTATPSTSSQSITPSSGKVLSKVTVNAIPKLHTTNSMIVPRWGTGPGSNVPATTISTRNPRIDFGNTTTYGSAEMVEIAMPEGYYAWSYGNSSLCIPTETKTVTPTTSAQTITPTEYNTASKYVKFLKSVTVNAISTQTKSATPSTSSQTISPDSGKYLSSVTVNAISPNLSTQTRYQHSSSNTTPLIMADAAFTSTVYDNVSKSNIGEYYQLRFNTTPDKSNNNMTAGWMNSNTLIAVTSQYLRDNLGINSTTVRAGQTIYGVTGANHSATYTYASGSTGGTVDLGAANTYRYVNATNVYNKGKADGAGSATYTTGTTGELGGGQSSISGKVGDIFVWTGNSAILESDGIVSGGTKLWYKNYDSNSGIMPYGGAIRFTSTTLKVNVTYYTTNVFYAILTH